MQDYLRGRFGGRFPTSIKAKSDSATAKKPSAVEDQTVGQSAGDRGLRRGGAQGGRGNPNQGRSAPPCPAWSASPLKPSNRPSRRGTRESLQELGYAGTVPCPEQSSWRSRSGRRQEALWPRNRPESSQPCSNRPGWLSRQPTMGPRADGPLPYSLEDHGGHFISRNSIWVPLSLGSAGPEPSTWWDHHSCPINPDSLSAARSSL